MVSAPLPAEGREADSKARLRLWIRLLRASRQIEKVTRERLKSQFDGLCRASMSWPHFTASQPAC